MASKKRKLSAAAASSSRPIDKTITTINSVTLTSTQTDMTLATASGPCTVRGLRWDFNLMGSADSAEAIYWAIYRLKEGYAVPAIDTTGLNQMIEPEQEVLVWGVAQLLDNNAGTGPAIQKDKGETKSMRKLMSGDRLVLSFKTLSANNSVVRGGVQFFCLY